MESRAVNWKLVMRLLVVGAAGTGNSALASITDLPLRETWYGGRTPGMGGAYVAIADDEHALLGNPAGIGRQGQDSKSVRSLDFPNLVVAGNRLSVGLLRTYAEGGPGDQNQVATELQDEPAGSVVWGHVGAFPSVTLGRFSLGMLMTGEATGDLERFDAPQASRVEAGQTYDALIKTQMDATAALVLGASFAYHSTGLVFGLAGRVGGRRTMSKESEMSDGTIRKADSLDDGWMTTFGAAVDAGVLWIPQRTPWIPTLGLTWRDAGNTRYRTVDGSGRIVRERENLALGISWDPLGQKRRGGMRFVVGIDAQHLTDERLEFRDKIHVGSEFRMGEYALTSPFAFRVGHNLRGISYGVGLDLAFFRMDYDSSVSMIQNGAGKTLDRRTYLRVSVDLLG